MDQTFLKDETNRQSSQANGMNRGNQNSLQPTFAYIPPQGHQQIIQTQSQGSYVVNYPGQVPQGAQVIVLQNPAQSGIAYGQPVSMPQPLAMHTAWQPSLPGAHIDANLPHNTNQLYCSSHCVGRSFTLAACYVVVLTILGVLSAYAPVFLVLLAIAPAALILTFMEIEYRSAVTKCQMAATFFEAVLWMLPLTALLLAYIVYFDEPLGLPETGLCAKCLAGYAFQAYFIAGTLEELLKYITVRRLLHAQFIVDPRSLIVYGCCAAAGFATVENILYVTSGNIAVGVARAITAVPLHCSTGIFMGCMLAERRFNNKKYRWPIILAPVIVIHGTYDMVIFTTNYGSGEPWAMALGLLAAVAVMVATYLGLRFMVCKLQREHCPVNLHTLIENGDVEIPYACCLGVCPKCCMA